MEDIDAARIYEFSEEKFHEIGVKHYRLSVFDHWLENAEADKCDNLTFNISKETGCLDDYYDGEMRFIKFYDKIFQMSDIYLTSSFVETGASNQDYDEFSKTVISSLREKVLMDIIAPGIKSRFIGGYDRTDLWIIYGPCELNIREISDNCGLFLLP